MFQEFESDEELIENTNNPALMQRVEGKLCINIQVTTFDPIY